MSIDPNIARVSSPPDGSQYAYHSDGSVTVERFNKTSPELNARQRRVRNRKLLSRVLDGKVTQASKWGHLGMSKDFVRYLEEQDHQTKKDQAIKLLDLGRARGGDDTSGAITKLTNPELNVLGVLVLNYLPPWPTRSYDDMVDGVVLMLMSTPPSGFEPVADEQHAAGS